MGSILLDAIVGARPNLMKIAPLAAAIAAEGTFQLRLIHTGQHYDAQMSDVFFKELGIPAPAFNLGVGSGSQGSQTAKIIEGYEKILLSGARPRGVIVVGDVTSTMACTLAASKLNIPVAHIEAGLRSYDRTMPEEINRIVTDALSEILFISEPDGMVNLAKEGHDRERLFLVGNIMVDTLYRELSHAQTSTVLEDLGLNCNSYAYMTLHRPSNVDDSEVFLRILGTVIKISKDLPVVFSVHPRTRTRLDQLGFVPPSPDRMRLIEPLSYRQNLRMVQAARAVLTDSGGIQEESAILNVPCLTLRDTTERPVTVHSGSSELVGASPGRILEAWERVKSGQWKRSAPIPLWDGHTSERIVERLVQRWANKSMVSRVDNEETSTIDGSVISVRRQSFGTETAANGASRHVASRNLEAEAEAEAVHSMAGPAEASSSR